jgi:hypothetical protein
MAPALRHRVRMRASIALVLAVLTVSIPVPDFVDLRR